MKNFLLTEKTNCVIILYCIIMANQRPLAAMFMKMLFLKEKFL